MANYDPDLDPILEGLRGRLDALETRPEGGTVDLSGIERRLEALEARPVPQIDMEAIKAVLRQWLDMEPQQPAPQPQEPSPAVTMPAGFKPLQDYGIDKSLSQNWGNTGLNIYLPTWGVGPESVGKPSLIEYHQDGSATLRAEAGPADPKNDNRTWYTGAMQVDRPKIKMGRVGAVVHVTRPNAVGAFFGYASNSKEIDFELIVKDGKKVWSPAVHMPKTGGGTAHSDKRQFNRPELQDRPQVLEYDLQPDRCDFYIDGELFETITPADMSSGYIWDTTTGMAQFLSVEHHGGWAGWTSADYAKGAAMRVYGIRIPGLT